MKQNNQIRISFLVSEELHEQIMNRAEDLHMKRNRYIIHKLTFLTWDEFQRLHKGKPMKEIQKLYKNQKP